MIAVIAGRGAVTPLARGAAASIAVQRTGIGAQAVHPFMLDHAGDPMVVARVAWAAEDTDGVARMADLAVPAALEALRELPPGRSVDLLIALPEPRPGLPAGYEVAVTDRIATALATRQAIAQVLFDARGHAAGLSLMAMAAARIARDPEALMLVGGVDSWLVPETLEWLDGIEALHSVSMPWGFCPGEGAAFCLLANATPAARLVLRGVGAAEEPNRIRSRTVCTAEALSAAWRSALASLPSGRRVDRIWCDLNSEPYRGDEIAFTVLRARERLSDDAEIVTPADCWGDVGAASGPLLAIAAEAAVAKGYAPGPMALLSASSEGGHRAALLVEALPLPEGAL